MAAVVSPFLFVFDIALALGLLVLAWYSLRTADLFRCSVVFIVYGIVMAIAWVRLRAPDVAIAEAAIGSGITGALLLGALRRLTGTTRRESTGTRSTK